MDEDDTRDEVERLFRNADLVMTGQTLDVLQYALNLSNQHLNSESIKALSLLLYPAFTEDKLSERGKHIENLRIKRKRRLLAESPGLDTLRCLDSNDDTFDDDDYEHATLDEIDSINWRDIIRIYTNSRYQIQRVDLSNNSIGDDGLSSLAKALEQPGCWCKHLDIRENDLTSESLDLLARSILTNSSLQYLDLSSNEFIGGLSSINMASSFDAFCSSILSRHIRPYILSYLQNSLKQPQKLEAAFKTHCSNSTNLARMSGASLKFHWNGLSNLSLRACSLKPNHVALLLDALPALKSLDIGENPDLGDEAASLLATYIIGPASKVSYSVAAQAQILSKGNSKQVSDYASGNGDDLKEQYISSGIVIRKWRDLLADEVRRLRLIGSKPVESPSTSQLYLALSTLRVPKIQEEAWQSIYGIPKGARRILAQATSGSNMSLGEVVALGSRCSDVNLDRLSLESIGMTHLGVKLIAEALIKRGAFQEARVNAVKSGDTFYPPTFNVRSLNFDGNWLPGSRHIFHDSGVLASATLSNDEYFLDSGELSTRSQEENDFIACESSLAILEHAVKVVPHISNISLVGCGGSIEAMQRIQLAASKNAAKQKEESEPWIVLGVSLAAARAYNNKQKAGENKGGQVEGTIAALARTQGIILPLAARIAEYTCLRNAIDKTSRMVSHERISSNAGCPTTSLSQQKGLISELKALHEAASGASQNLEMRGGEASEFIDFVAAKLDTLTKVAPPRPTEDVFGTPSLTFGEYFSSVRSAQDVSKIKVWKAPQALSEAALQAAIFGRYASNPSPGTDNSFIVNEGDSYSLNESKSAALPSDLQLNHRARSLIRLINSHAFANYTSRVLGYPSIPASSNLMIEGKRDSVVPKAVSPIHLQEKKEAQDEPTEKDLIRASRLIALNPENPGILDILQTVSKKRATLTESSGAGSIASRPILESASNVQKLFHEAMSASSNTPGIPHDITGSVHVNVEPETRNLLPENLSSSPRAGRRASNASAPSAKSILARHLAGLPANKPPVTQPRRERSINSGTVYGRRATGVSETKTSAVQHDEAKRLDSQKVKADIRRSNIDTVESGKEDASKAGDAQSQAFKQWPSFAKPAFRK